MRSISICFLCQKGGEPASSVYMITPELHLQTRQLTIKQPGTHISPITPEITPASIVQKLMRHSGGGSGWHLDNYIVGTTVDILHGRLLITNRDCTSDCQTTCCSHVHSWAVSAVSCIHGALDDLRSKVTRGPTHLCNETTVVSWFVCFFGKSALTEHPQGCCFFTCKVRCKH